MFLFECRRPLVQILAWHSLQFCFQIGSDICRILSIENHSDMILYDIIERSKREIASSQVIFCQYDTTFQEVDGDPRLTVKF